MAVPEQRPRPDAAGGERLFRDAECAACHMPTLVSGDHPVRSVANQVFHPFTDLLLHDMGPELADSRPDFDASGNEWRTPPLWGIGLLQTVNRHQLLLHDGRTRGVAEPSSGTVAWPPPTAMPFAPCPVINAPPSSPSSTRCSGKLR